MLCPLTEHRDIIAAAIYIDRSSGRETSDLPVDHPTKFDLSSPQYRDGPRLTSRSRFWSWRPGDRVGERRTFLAMIAGAWSPRRSHTAAPTPGEGTPGRILGRDPSDTPPVLSIILQGAGARGLRATIVIEYRWDEGRSDRLPDLADELVRLKVDVILAGSNAVAVAAKNVTRTIPIVMATGGDPVGLGLVASLARPGGNVTGLSYGVGMEVVGKGLELLKETVPKVRRVAVLSNPANAYQALAIEKVSDAPCGGSAASALEARGPTSSKMHGDGLSARGGLFDPGSFFGFHRDTALDLAARAHPGNHG